MQWSDIPFRPSQRVLRQFAALWLVCFSALGASQYYLRGHPRVGLALAVAAVTLGIPGLLRPALLRWVFVSWMVLAFPIGWGVASLVLAVLYFLVLTPVAVVLRWRGRDWLGRQPAPERTSFWEPKQTPVDLRSYFRQY